jgi:hypothetical protein
VRADRDPRADHLCDDRREGLIGLELDDVGLALDQESRRVADGIIIAGVIGHERHVAHDHRQRMRATDRCERRLNTAAHARGQGQQHIERDVDRAIKAEGHFAGRVADQQNLDPAACEPARCCRVVARQAGERDKVILHHAPRERGDGAPCGHLDRALRHGGGRSGCTAGTGRCDGC